MAGKLETLLTGAVHAAFVDLDVYCRASLKVTKEGYVLHEPFPLEDLRLGTIAGVVLEMGEGRIGVITLPLEAFICLAGAMMLLPKERILEMMAHRELDDEGELTIHEVCNLIAGSIGRFSREHVLYGQDIRLHEVLLKPGEAVDGMPALKGDALVYKFLLKTAHGNPFHGRVYLMRELVENSFKDDPLLVELTREAEAVAVAASAAGASGSFRLGPGQHANSPSQHGAFGSPPPGWNGQPSQHGWNTPSSPAWSLPPPSGWNGQRPAGWNGQPPQGGGGQSPLAAYNNSSATGWNAQAPPSGGHSHPPQGWNGPGPASGFGGQSPAGHGGQPPPQGYPAQGPGQGGPPPQGFNGQPGPAWNGQPSPGWNAQQPPPGWNGQQPPPGWNGQPPPGWNGQPPPGWNGQPPSGWNGQPPPGWNGQPPSGWNGQPPPGWNGQPPPGWNGQPPPGGWNPQAQAGWGGPPAPGRTGGAGPGHPGMPPGFTPFGGGYPPGHGPSSSGPHRSALLTVLNEPPGLQTSKTSLQGVQILIVDDSWVARRALAKQLIPYGCVVSDAKDTETATQLMARRQIDILILDVLLPGESGLQFCSRLRAEGGLEKMAVIMISGNSTSDCVVRSINAGASFFLVKPVTEEYLVKVLSGVLRQYREKGGRAAAAL